MVQQFRADLAGLAAQCHGGSPAAVPWICGDTTYDWKNNTAHNMTRIRRIQKQRSPTIYLCPS
ncbi:hypothetical protein AD42_3963 [Escherichia coli 3-073-06_S4_C3]|nr:hypothetical protein AD42_3963 [Escherichia coli 3-073-06_S4_C3]